MPGNNQVNVPEYSCWGFFSNIRSVTIPQLDAEIDMLNGRVDEAEAQLKLAKAKYKRQYIYITSGVAFTVAILQGIKYALDMTNDEPAGEQSSFNIWMDFACVIVPFGGTGLSKFVGAWDSTADDHLNEIAQTRIAMPR